jgi:hypothetical protein
MNGKLVRFSDLILFLRPTKLTSGRRPFIETCPWIQTWDQFPRWSKQSLSTVTPAVSPLSSVDLEAALQLVDLKIHRGKTNSVPSTLLETTIK